MAEIIIKYNNTTISPTPLINRSNQMIDMDTGRWGSVEEIELKGFLTGITSYSGYSVITSLFTGNFGTLTVTDGTNTLYNWTNLAVEEISFSDSKWPIHGFTPYSVKLKSFNIPSGVIDASNEYSFSQAEDGIVSVSHKIAAKGVNTSNGALNNAIAFVNTFTGKNPYSNCAPVFIPNGVGILMSLNENLDRINQNYSVVETYKFVTGSTKNFVEVSTLSVNESSSAEYVNVDFNGKFQASAITGSVNQITSQLTNNYIMDKISSIYGIATGNLYRNTISITQDSGAATIEVKANYISGLGSDVSGYFDWIVSLDDNVQEQNITWKIDGEFICKGPTAYRANRANAFKFAITGAGGQGYEMMLKNTMTNSVIYTNLKRNDYLTISAFTIAENTGLGTLKLSATFSDFENPFNLRSPKSEIFFEPAKWAYDILPSANIEGHYVLQDLQMKTKPKITFSLSSLSSGNLNGVVSTLSNILQTFSGAYCKNGFVKQDSITTGYKEINLEYQILADSILDSEFLTNHKVHGSFASNYTRPKGYKFGY